MINCIASQPSGIFQFGINYSLCTIKTAPLVAKSSRVSPPATRFQSRPCTLPAKCCFQGHACSRCTAPPTGGNTESHLSAQWHSYGEAVQARAMTPSPGKVFLHTFASPTTSFNSTANKMSSPSILLIEYGQSISITASSVLVDTADTFARPPLWLPPSLAPILSAGTSLWPLCRPLWW